jgi:hypothetical protein
MLSQAEKSPTTPDRENINAIDDNSFSLEDKSNERDCEQCAQFRARINELTNQLQEAQTTIR